MKMTDSVSHLHQFLMTLQTENLSTETSDFLQQMIILKSFNSVFYAFDTSTTLVSFKDCFNSFDFVLFLSYTVSSRQK